MAAAATTTKMSWRLQEFVAHSGNVSCLVLGKSSGRLLATGGEDGRVNIYSVNKPNCVMSLTGHSNPVECVQFKGSEEQVVAGSQSGSLRVWDLEAAKILRTLAGHKANISSLDFHPFGEYLASGSMDTNIKIWDLRRKGCVFRYKGHTQVVRCVAFSPDGKWLASASDDSTIKLWDLTAGKVITEFTAHSGPVNIVQFHPTEYLLASGSSDRTIKMWDLEKFNMIGSSEGETGPVRCVTFNPDGCCLYSGSVDSLHVYGWEPDCCFDMVPVGWGKVADLSICNNQLIGVSHQLTSVSSYVVDLTRVKKSGSSEIQGHIQDNQPITEPAPKGSTLRRSYDRPTTTCSSQSRVKARQERWSPEGEHRSPSSEDEKEEKEKESTAEIQNAEDYKEIFSPKTAISRTPPKFTEPFPAPLEEDRFVVRASQVTDVITPMHDKQQPGQLRDIPMASSTPVQRVEPTVVSSAPRPIPTARPPPPVSVLPAPRSEPQTSIAKPKAPPNVIPSARNKPIGLNVADFLPSSRSPTVLNDDEVLSQMSKGHDTMRVMLANRIKNLETVRAAWANGDVKVAMDTAVAIDDMCIIVDVLNILNLKPTLWKLDLCTSILPQIEKLLHSKYERLAFDPRGEVQVLSASYIQTGYLSLKLILKRFWPLISDTLKAPPPVGVDITREERHEKCKACYKQLKNLSNVVKNKADQVGRHGSTFKELQLLLAPLDY